MNGRIVGGLILGAGLIAGVAIYYLQVFAFYREVPATAQGAEMRLVSIASGQPEPILSQDFRAIDADSSPLRFRACFRTTQSLAMLSETYAPIAKPVPNIAPYWFDCFDAAAIAAALERGDALAFLSEPDIHRGVDRIIAVFADGRAYAWHQLNDKATD